MKISAFLILAMLVSFLAVVSLPTRTANTVVVPLVGAFSVDAAALFSAKCAICHGKDGRGLSNWKSKGQPDFADANWQKSRTDAQIADAISNGRGKYMPAWKGKLSDEEIKGLVGRVRSFGKK